MENHTNLRWSGSGAPCPSQALFYELRRAVLAHCPPAVPGRLHPRTGLRDCLAAEQARLIPPLIWLRLGGIELPLEDRVFGVPVLEVDATWLALWFPGFLYWLIVCADPGIPRFLVLPGFLLPPVFIELLVRRLSRPTWIGVRTLGDLTRWLLHRNEPMVERIQAAGAEPAGTAVPDRAEAGLRETSQSPIQPLHCPEFDRVEDATPWAEKALVWVPILGWVAGAHLWWRRVAPLVEDIESQLRARPEPDPALWGDVPQRAEIGRYVCTVARDELGWPNDRFIPDDRFDIVFWPHLDGLDALAALQEIEHHLDLEVEDSEVDRWLNEKVTLGEVVDYLLVLATSHGGASDPPK